MMAHSCLTDLRSTAMPSGCLDVAFLRYSHLAVKRAMRSTIPHCCRRIYNHIYYVFGLKPLLSVDQLISYLYSILSTDRDICICTK